MIPFKRLSSVLATLLLCLPAFAIDFPGITETRTAPGRFSLI